MSFWDGLFSAAMLVSGRVILFYMPLDLLMTQPAFHNLCSTIPRNNVWQPWCPPQAVLWRPCPWWCRSRCIQVSWHWSSALDTPLPGSWYKRSSKPLRNHRAADLLHLCLLSPWQHWVLPMSHPQVQSLRNLLQVQVRARHMFSLVKANDGNEAN